MIEECLVVEFAVTGDDCPLADASRSVETTIDCQPPQLRRDGNALLRFSTAAAEGGDASGGLVEVLDADDRVRYLHVSRTDGRETFRCLSKHPCVVHELADVGFLVDSIEYRDGVERYAGAVVGHDVLQGVLEAAGETVGVTLQRVHPLGEEEDHPIGTRWDLTPAQAEALRAASEMGYFSVPREVTAAEVAAELGISKSAFLERLRRGQDGLLRQVLS